MTPAATSSSLLLPSLFFAAGGGIRLVQDSCAFFFLSFSAVQNTREAVLRELLQRSRRKRQRMQRMEEAIKTQEDGGVLCCLGALLSGVNPSESKRD